MIDLHVHTTASDGVYPPEKVIDIARNLGLEAISITDHDTLDGVKVLLDRKLVSNPDLLTGVEISSVSDNEFTSEEGIHILGYRIDTENTLLNNELDKLKKAREERNPRIIKKLNDLGIDISMDKLKAFAGDVQIGRAHLGRFLFENNHVESVDKAFSRFIGKGMPAYVEKYRIPILKALEIVSKAGGVPVIAHPGLIDIDRENFSCFFEFLKEHGLKGIEVDYPSHSDSFRSFLRNECKRLDLIATGGSDFHGYKHEGLIMGKGRSNINISYSVYEKIMNI